MQQVRFDSMHFDECKGEEWAPSSTDPTHCPEGNRFDILEVPTCFLKPPFWWRGTLQFPSRPNGNPNDYKTNRTIIPTLPEIPNILGRLEIDEEGFYLPGQIAMGTGTEKIQGKKITNGKDDETPNNLSNIQLDSRMADAEETSQPQFGLNPQKLSSVPYKCKNEAPFWWWCNDNRERMPVGDINEYSSVSRQQNQPQPTFQEILRLDTQNEYLPGEIAAGSKPCPTKFATDRPPVEIPALEMTQSCPPNPGCPRHGHTDNPPQGEASNGSMILKRNREVCNENDTAM